MNQNPYGLLISILYMDSLSLDELEKAKRELDAAVIRKKRLEEHERQQAIIRKNRQQFINRVVDFGLSHKLPISIDQLHEIGEYLYDTKVLGISEGEIMSKVRAIG